MNLENKGEIVFEKGSIGDKFYIILRGEVGKKSCIGQIW